MKNAKTLLPLIPLGFLSFAWFSFVSGYVTWAFIIVLISAVFALLIIAINAQTRQ